MVSARDERWFSHSALWLTRVGPRRLTDPDVGDHTLSQTLERQVHTAETLTQESESWPCPIFYQVAGAKGHESEGPRVERDAESILSRKC